MARHHDARGQVHAPLLAAFHHAVGYGQPGRQRFFAKDGLDSGLGRGHHCSGVGSHRQHWHGDIDRLACQHLLVGGVAGHPEAAAAQRQIFRIRIGNSHHLAQGMHVKGPGPAGAGPSAANDADPIFDFSFFSHEDPSQLLDYLGK